MVGRVSGMDAKALKITMIIPKTRNIFFIFKNVRDKKKIHYHLIL